MNITEWNETWQRIKDRFPNWKPTATEAEDWCMGLRVYSVKMVEFSGSWIARNYSSKIPRLKWYLKCCEKLKQNEWERNAVQEPTHDDLIGVLDREKENAIEKLEGVPIDTLREATVKVLKEHGNIIAKPSDANVREWKNTLRSMVYCEIFKDEKNVNK